MVFYRKGQRVTLVYGPRYRPMTDLRGCTGTVKVVPRGRGIRNYGVLLDDGRKVVVPWGNLRALKEEKP